MAYRARYTGKDDFKTKVLRGLHTKQLLLTTDLGTFVITPEASGVGIMTGTTEGGTFITIDVDEPDNITVGWC